MTSNVELTQVSAAGDGTVWGVGATPMYGGYAAYKYNSSTNSWGLMPGALIQVSVGSASQVWGVNSFHNVYKYDFGANNWKKMNGNSSGLTQVSAAADGSVWGLGTIADNGGYEVLGYAVTTNFTCSVTEGSYSSGPLLFSVTGTQLTAYPGQTTLDCGPDNLTTSDAYWYSTSAALWDGLPVCTYGPFYGGFLLPNSILSGLSGSFTYLDGTTTSTTTCVRTN